MFLRRSRGSNSNFKITYFTPFVAVLFIAITYAYYHYKFSMNGRVNFNTTLLYGSSNIFKPKFDIYTVVVYSSRDFNGIKKLEDNIKNQYPILAIDFYQSNYKFKNRNIVSYRASTSEMLNLSRSFNIRSVPAIFLIKRVKKSRYVQYSSIEYLNKE